MGKIVKVRFHVNLDFRIINCIHCACLDDFKNGGRIGEHLFKVGIYSHFKTYWNVILFAITVVPDHSHRKSLTEPLPALVPDPADEQSNQQDPAEGEARTRNPWITNPVL